MGAAAKRRRIGRWIAGSVLVMLAGFLWLARAMLFPPAGDRWAAMPAARSIPTKPGRASILFAGDTHFGESYFADESAPSVLATRGYAYPVARVRPLAESADLVIVNLETPLTHRTDSPLRHIKPWVHWGDPEKTAQALRSLGVRAVSLANNHAFDALAPGLGDTMSALASRGIDTFGAGPNLARAAEPYRADLVVGRHQLRLCVLGALQRNWRNWVRAAYATSTGPGTYPLAASTLTGQIRAAKQADPTLFVVAFPHWGQNYAPRSPEQSQIGRALLDAGADLVLGHGAHLLQAIEAYGGRLIVHGLGNFVFLSPGRYQGTQPWSAVVRLDFAERDSVLRLAMVVYFLARDNAATGYQPRLLVGDDFERAAQLWLAGSAELATLAKKGQDAVGQHVRLELGALRQP
jgi:poly-gamma-glutamate capsule biosynthesis protein CapA/YwtB (metallophosphatase superfamily)